MSVRWMNIGTQCSKTARRRRGEFRGELRLCASARLSWVGYGTLAKPAAPSQPASSARESIKPSAVTSRTGWPWL
jgi:hypothetical protein